MDQGSSSETDHDKDISLLQIQNQTIGVLEKTSPKNESNSQPNDDSVLLTNDKKDNIVLDKNQSTDLQEKRLLLNEIKLSSDEIDELLGPESDTW